MELSQMPKKFTDCSELVVDAFLIEIESALLSINKK
jgi:hypothetical protein